jgi:uncharacterized protein (DUF58 family)
VIRLEHKPLAEYLFRREQVLISQTDVSAFDARRNLFAPGFLALVFALGFFCLTFFSRVAVLLLLTEIAGLLALYIHTWYLAKKLSLKRVLPNRPFREMDQVEVLVEIRNRAGSGITGLLVEDSFSCASKAQVRAAPDRIGPRAMLRFSYKKVCDGGMGRHRIGPLLARVTDPLGMFEFRVIEDSVLEVDVYPRVEAVPVLPVRASIEGVRYGNYEVASRGLSVNFAGVRPYERGDSLRHIAWKLSSRGQGLLVKEFEKVVSCDVNIVLNLAPQWQVGRRSTSTWECAKDVALAVIQQQVELGNTVGFFSDRSFVEPAAGSDHFHTLARHISGLNRGVATASEIENLEITHTSLLGKYQKMFPRGSNIFYITPFNLSEFQESEVWLKRFAVEGYTVICIFIDTNSFWLQFIESVSTGLIIGAKLLQGLEDVSEQLKRGGVQTYIVKNQQSLREVFHS